MQKRPNGEDPREIPEKIPGGFHRIGIHFEEENPLAIPQHCPWEGDRERRDALAAVVALPPGLPHPPRRPRRRVLAGGARHRERLAPRAIGAPQARPLVAVREADREEALGGGA
eukprot:gene5155-biopygen5791